MIDFLQQKTSLFRSLSLKVSICIIALFLIFTSIFFYFFYTFHRDQLLESLQISTEIQSRLILYTLEQAMLLNRREILQNSIENLLRESENKIERVMILNKRGEVKVSNDGALLGKRIDKNDASCIICHRYTPEERSRTVRFQTSSGEMVFRNVSPIFNKPLCYGCHSPADKINGVLILDYSLAPAERILSSNINKILMLTGSLIFVIMVTVYLLMDRIILRRIRSFIKVTKNIEEGDLHARVNLDGHDEIAHLATHFNKMAESVFQLMGEVTRAKEYLENLINSLNEGVIVLNKELKIIDANRAFVTTCELKRQDIIGKRCPAIIEDVLCKDRPLECPSLITLESGTVQTRIKSLNIRGEERYFEISSSPIMDEKGNVIHAVEVWRDITQRRQMEAYLSHSERLSTVGLLASGISHEINNPLASILTCIEGLQRRIKRIERLPSELNEFPHYLDLIQKEVMRCKTITEKLLVYCQKSPHRIQPIDIRKIIEDIVSLVRFEASRHRTEVLLKWNADIPLIKGEESQIKQLYFNIIINAIQACIENGGRVIIEGGIEGDYAVVKVLDNGKGVRKEDLERVFDPFFTTKPPGTGTGLGLFIARNIAQNYGGRIELSSQWQRGTTVTIRLPVKTLSTHVI